MFELVSREQWGARPPTKGVASIDYPVNELYVHHEGGGVWSSLDRQQEELKMRTLQKSMQSRGYTDLAYSLAVFPSGRLYEGRDLDVQDAATAGRAGESISLLFVGNYDTQAPARQALLAAAWVVQLAQATGRLTVTAQILGHRDVRQTACPGNHLYRALPDLRALVRITDPGPSTEDDDMPLSDHDFARIKKIVHDEVVKIWRAQEMTNLDVARARKGSHEAVVSIMRGDEYQKILRDNR